MRHGFGPNFYYSRTLPTHNSRFRIVQIYGTKKVASQLNRVPQISSSHPGNNQLCPLLKTDDQPNYRTPFDSKQQFLFLKLLEVGETQTPLLTCCLARARVADYPILSISNASLNPLFASGFLPMMHFNPTPGFLGNDKLIIWPPSVNDFTPHHTASHVKHQLTTHSSMYLVEPPIFTVFIRCLHFGFLSHTSRQPLSPALHFP